jgi:glutathione peroxidase
MMTKLIAFASLAALLGAALSSARAADEKKSPLDYKATSIDGKEVDLSKYKGKVALIVNVASQCGNTPQYAGLEKIYKKYKDDGLVVMGFPANEFGKQEPGSNDEIAQFCKDNYSVDFPMFSKIVVKGEGIAPIYKHLTSKETNPQHAGDITWNFEKFLIGRNGQVVARFKPKTGPESEEVVKAIEAELAKK